LLSGDASVKVMEDRLRSIMTGTVAGAAEGMNSLAFLGIATNRDGSISLNDTKLSSAISTRFDDLEKLFSGENGIANRLDKVVTELTASNGVFTTREKSMRGQLSGIEEQRDKLNARLTTMEARYRAQFTALDILVGQLQQTGNFLTQQLDATAQIINRKN
jgi:flagellar hook-associated protein 2